MAGRSEGFQLGAGQLEGAKARCAGCGKGIEIMGGDWTEPESGTWACQSRKQRGGWSTPAAHAPAPTATKAFQLR